MADERRPIDDGCRNGSPEDMRPPESGGAEPPRGRYESDRYDVAGRSRRGGAGIMALAIIMLIAVAGLLGLWWWTQREDVTITPATEEQIEEAIDPDDDPDNDPDNGLDLPSFRGPPEEPQPDDPDEAPADERSPSGPDGAQPDGVQPDSEQQEEPQQDAPDAAAPDQGMTQPDSQPDQGEPGAADPGY